MRRQHFANGYRSLAALGPGRPGREQLWSQMKVHSHTTRIGSSWRFWMLGGPDFETRREEAAMGKRLAQTGQLVSRNSSAFVIVWLLSLALVQLGERVFGGWPAPPKPGNLWCVLLASPSPSLSVPASRLTSGRRWLPLAPLNSASTRSTESAQRKAHRRISP